MYSQSDLDQLSADLRRRWIIYTIPAVLLLGTQIYSLTVRNEVLTIAAGILLCFWSIFYIGLNIVPVMRYRTHVNNMLHGITHSIHAVFQHFDADDSLVDGVNFRAMHIICKDDAGEDYERLFYWDLEKPLPAFQKGQALEIVYHDRQVADVKPI